MWFWWMSYHAIHEIDKEILELKDELKVIYAKLKDLVGQRRYYQNIIKIHTYDPLEDEEYRVYNKEGAETHEHYSI